MKHLELLDDSASLERGQRLINVFQECHVEWGQFDRERAAKVYTAEYRTLDQVVEDEVEELQLPVLDPSLATAEQLAALGDKVLQAYAPRSLLVAKRQREAYVELSDEHMQRVSGVLREYDEKPIAVRALPDSRYAIISHTRNHVNLLWNKRVIGGYLPRSGGRQSDNFMVAAQNTDNYRRYYVVKPLDIYGRPQVELAIGN